MTYRTSEVAREGVRRRLSRLRERRGGAAAHNAIWEAKNPEKARAHRMVEAAVASGKLSRRPCADCGSTDFVHAHHDDYSKPLEVRWLCPAHHIDDHRYSRRGNVAEMSGRGSPSAVKALPGRFPPKTG